MPVQNRKSKISARPDLAINSIQILISTTFYSLLSKKGQFTVIEDGLLGRYLVIAPKESKLK